MTMVNMNIQGKVTTTLACPSLVYLVYYSIIHFSANILCWCSSVPLVIKHNFYMKPAHFDFLKDFEYKWSLKFT